MGIDIKKLKNYGFFLLEKRDYSVKMFKDKMLEYCIKNLYTGDLEELVNEATNFFLEKNFLNDYEYGKSFIYNHKYSKKKLKFMLMQKGIGIEIIEKLLIEDNNDKKLIIEQWQKLGNREKDKKIQSLMRKGFLYRDITEVIREEDLC